MKKVLGCTLALICAAGVCSTFVGCKKETYASSRYEINAEYVPECKTLTGTLKCTFENGTENELSVLKFQLYPNAYRKDALYRPISDAYENAAYYNGESYGEIVVSSVNGSKNWEVMGEDENILYVYLEKSLFPGDKVVLDIGFMTKLAQVDHRTGITEHTINLGNFFPILCGMQNGGFVESVYYSDGDPFYSECADYKMTLTVPKEYTVASTGEITDERVLESKKVYTMSRSNVRDFALVLSDEFREINAEIGGKTLRYYYYTDETPTRTLETVTEAFAFYEETFGAYPYTSYSVAQTGFCYGGMEYPCLTMLSDGLQTEEKPRAIAHETAHQWWYGVVGSNALDNAWQDEGLAEYSAITFFEKYEKYGYTREDVVTAALKEYRSYYDVYGSVLGRTDTRMTRNLKDYLSEYEYKCLSFDKAVVMLDTLRKSVGDKKFFASLRKYYSTNAYTMCEPNALIGCFEKSGLDVAGFFESFLEGKAIL